MKERFSEAVKQARRGAVKLEELFVVKEMQITACRDFLLGRITLSQFKILVDTLVVPGTVLVDTPQDLRKLLAALKLTPEFIEKCVAHEETHLTTAQNFGLKAQLGVGLKRTNGRIVFFNTFTSIDIPGDIEESLARTFVRKIIEAPGEDMSDSDKRSLP